LNVPWRRAPIVQPFFSKIMACRGALDGLVAEVVEDHIRNHVIDPSAARSDPRSQAAEQLVEIVHSYLT
jgi:FrmR/RcnR family transcriptional regulator, repressor of frmRAB operon